LLNFIRTKIFPRITSPFAVTTTAIFFTKSNTLTGSIFHYSCLRLRFYSLEYSCSRLKSRFTQLISHPLNFV